MQTIVLKPLQHRNSECIGLYFDKTTVLQGVARSLINCKWSKTNKCWYIPCDQDSYNNLRCAASGIATLETHRIKEYLSGKKQMNRSKQDLSGKDKTPTEILQPVALQKNRNRVTQKMSTQPHENNQHVIPALIRALQLKAYSESTIRTYSNEIAQYLSALKGHDADNMSPERIKDYL